MFSSSSELAVSTRCVALFSTGSDSPVKAACATNRSLAVRMRQSAGIMSPADSSTTSPGTRSASGSSMRREPLACGATPSARRTSPSEGSPASLRSTVAVFCTIALSASAARLERRSCAKRSSVEMTTIEPMMMTPRQDWSSGSAIQTSVTHDSEASAVSSRLKGLRYEYHRWTYQRSGASWSTSLRPCRSRAALAWASLRPPARLPKRWNSVSVS